MDNFMHEILRLAQKYEAIGILRYINANPKQKLEIRDRAERTVKEINERHSNLIARGDRDLYERMEDERLDDPRHGQAAALNKPGGFS